MAAVPVAAVPVAAVPVAAVPVAAVPVAAPAPAAAPASNATATASTETNVVVNISNHGPGYCSKCNLDNVVNWERYCGCKAWGFTILFCFLFFPLIWLPCCCGCMRDDHKICRKCKTVYEKR